MREILIIWQMFGKRIRLAHSAFQYGAPKPTKAGTIITFCSLSAFSESSWVSPASLII